LKEKLCLYVLKEKHWNPHMLTKGKPWETKTPKPQTGN
jgi:hypothetical protein